MLTRTRRAVSPTHEHKTKTNRDKVREMTQVKDDTLPEIEIELEEVEPLNNMESIEEQPEPQIEEEEVSH